MRPWLLLVALAACTRAPDRLVGAWAVNTEALADDPELKALDEETRRRAVEMAQRAVAGMALEFQPGGEARVDLGATRLAGHYTIQRAEGDALTVETRLRVGDAWHVRTLEVVFQGDRLLVTGPDGRPMAFRRQASR